MTTALIIGSPLIAALIYVVWYSIKEWNHWTAIADRMEK